MEEAGILNENDENIAQHFEPAVHIENEIESEKTVDTDQGAICSQSSHDDTTSTEIPVQCEKQCDNVNAPPVPVVPAEECHIQPEHFRHMVITEFDDTYLKTTNGVVRLLQVVISVLALAVTASAGWQHGGIYNLPNSWRLRIFIFVTTLTSLTSLLFLLIQVTKLIDMFRLVPWAPVDMVVYGAYVLLYLVASSMMASAAVQCASSHTQWTADQLYVAMALGYSCVLLYGFTAVAGYKRWRTCAQYRRYRLKDIIQSTDEEIF